MGGNRVGAAAERHLDRRITLRRRARPQGGPPLFDNRWTARQGKTLDHQTASDLAKTPVDPLLINDNPMSDPLKGFLPNPFDIGEILDRGKPSRCFAVFDDAFCRRRTNARQRL